MATYSKGRTAHDAASLDDAKVAAWVPSPGSADADLLPEIPVIRSRARDLARNNGIAAGLFQTLTDNIVGSRLRLCSIPNYKLLGKDKQWARELGTQIETYFEMWSGTNCDITRTNTLVGMTNLALRSCLESSDVICLYYWTPGSIMGYPWGTRLGLVEGDRLTTPINKLDNPRIRSGVEFDEFGAPLRYYIQRNHPGDSYGLYNAVPSEIEAWDAIDAFTPWGRRLVLHLFDRQRPGQTRGKSVLTSLMADFKLSGSYFSAELHGALANSLVAGFIESSLPNESISEMLGADTDDLVSYWKEVSSKYHRKKMESGVFMTLPVGTRISGMLPNRTNSAFKDFVSAVNRNISAGANIPYELLMKDFSQTNYSSARAALLEAWRYFNSRRAWLVDHWLNPILDSVLEEAVNRRFIDITPEEFYANRLAYTKCRWIFSGRGWVDPVKEAEAAALRIRTGLSTYEAESAEQGLDWEEVFEQRAVEQALQKDLNLSFDTDSSKSEKVNETNNDN